MSLQQAINKAYVNGQTHRIITLFSTIICFAIYIAIIWLLCKGIKKQVEKRNATRIAIYIVVTIFLFWPAAIGQGIYVALKWKEPLPTKEEHKYTPTIGSQADYERWKAEREKRG